MIKPRKMHLSAEEIRYLHCDERLTTSEIGTRIGVTPHTIQAWMVMFGIPNARKRPMPNESELRRLYLDERLTTYQIADRLGCCSSTVGNYLRHYGIDRRLSGNGLLSRGLTPPTRDELNHLVHVEHRSYEEIARLYGVDFTAIPYWLKKYGLPRPKIWDTRRKGLQIVMPSKDELRSLYEAGESLRAIGERVGVSDSCVGALCRRYGIPLRSDGFDGGNRRKCNDGHLVRSVYERRVDDWLSEQCIAHLYEPRLPFRGNFKADFYANDWYIEIWGVRQNPSYSERQERKLAMYRKAGLPLIELAMHTFNKDQNGLWHRRLARVLTPPKPNAYSESS